MNSIFTWEHGGQGGSRQQLEEKEGHGPHSPAWPPSPSPGPALGISGSHDPSF